MSSIIVVGEITNWAFCRELLLPMSDVYCISLLENSRKDNISVAIKKIKSNVGGTRTISFMLKQLDELIADNKDLKRFGEIVVATINNYYKYVGLLYRDNLILIKDKEFDILIYDGSCASKFVASNLPIIGKGWPIIEKTNLKSVEEAYNTYQHLYISGERVLDEI